MKKLKVPFALIIASLLVFTNCTKDDKLPNINQMGIRSWELITEIEGVNIDKAFRLHVDEDNVLWIGTFGNGLIKMDGGNISQLTTENSTLPDDIIYAMDSDNDGFLWGGTGNGLFKYKTDFTVYNSSNSEMILDKAWSIALDNSNTVWFENGNAEEGGLMKFDQTEGNWQFYTPNNSDIPNGIINDIHITEDGTIWTGHGMTNGVGGIWKKSADGEEKVYNIANSSLNYNWISTIKNDAAGTIWSGTDAPIYLDATTLHGGIQNLIDNDFMDHNPSHSGKTTNRVTAMEFDCNGNLWVATSLDAPTFEFVYELSVYKGGKWYVLSNEIENFPNLYISDIEVDGETVWISAPDHGLIKIRIKCE